LPDLLRLIARSRNHHRCRTNVVQAVQEDEAIGDLFQAAFSMDKAVEQYKINMATKIPIFGQYTPEAIGTMFFGLILFNCKQRAYDQRNCSVARRKLQ
jgi:hypothetical protein